MKLSRDINRHGLESFMFCHRCDNALHFCVCDDLNDRMRELTDRNGAVYSRWCKTCDQHYCRCDCEEPDWWLRNEGELVRRWNDKIVVHGKMIDA